MNLSGHSSPAMPNARHIWTARKGPRCCMLSPTRKKEYGEGPVTVSLPMGQVERQPKKSPAGYFQFTGVHYGQRSFGGGFCFRRGIWSERPALTAGWGDGEKFSPSLAGVFLFG